MTHDTVAKKGNPILGCYVAQNKGDYSLLVLCADHIKSRLLLLVLDSYFESDTNKLKEILREMNGVE